jgi:hypothetical protein
VSTEREQSDTRRELEVVARRLVGETSKMSADGADAAKKAGPAVAVLGALVGFLWGLRRGRRRKVYVQVKRKR